MIQKLLRREGLMWAALLIPLIYIAIIWQQIPDTIPTHFNIKGEPDAWGSKTFGTLLLPGMNVFIYFVLLFIPRIDPRYKHYAQFERTYHGIRLVVHAFFSLLSIVIVHVSMTGSVFGVRFIPVFAFLMIAIIGYFLPKVKSNFFVGIRTPWTLSNEEVWKKSHEFGGKVMFYSGLTACFLILILPGEYLLWVIFPAVIMIAIVPVVYSYIVYRKVVQQ